MSDEARPVWVVRNDKLTEQELLDRSMIAIGWDDITDSLIGLNFGEVRAIVRAANPDASRRRSGNWAGAIWRVATRMQVGDIVVAPVRHTGKVNIGVIAGPARWEPEEPVHKLRRDVKWLITGVRRTDLSELSRQGLKSQLTAYAHRDAEEFRGMVAAAEGYDPDAVRELVRKLVDEIEGLGLDAGPYRAVVEGDTPVEIARIVDRGAASPLFVKLVGLGRPDLTIEGLIAAHAHHLGVTTESIERASARLDFYLA